MSIRNTYTKAILVVLTIFFTINSSFELAIICFVLALFFILDPLWNWVKEGKDEAKKIDGYYPEDKLKEYSTLASKKTAEVFDSNTKFEHRSIPHKTPVAAKNFLTELEKIFK